ncbi:MAG TPA: menaquinone biosynthesis protein [Ktedonobacterales bacterium]|nr:menaquinone biosynthesis protein [Ktedonobacterales bacterium]
MIVGNRHEAMPRATGSAQRGVHLGVIDYLNVAPVYARILTEMGEAGASAPFATLAGVPARMNDALADGVPDISNVSSYAFGVHAREWLLVPRLSVAAHGRVDSVLLFSWHDDWRALDGRPVALTDQSATSIELVKALAANRHHITPSYTLAPGDLDAMLLTHDAALLIGDRALVERHARRVVAGRGVPHVFDLAAEWQAWTDLPFVFAVWAARADRVEALRASGVVARLRASKDWGLAHLDAIAAEYAERLGLTPAVCAEYLRLLDYELGPRDLVGLRTFLEMTVPRFAWSTVRPYED